MQILDNEKNVIKEFETELENNENELQEEIMSEEELKELLAAMSDDVKLDTSNIEDCEIDLNEFEQGLGDISYYLGQLTGLISIGLTKELATDFVMNLANINHNQILQDKINNNQLEIAKTGSVSLEKNSI